VAALFSISETPSSPHGFATLLSGSSFLISCSYKGFQDMFYCFVQMTPPHVECLSGSSIWPVLLT
jgi:hypothetical protein